jgi:hypothetical protein
MYQISSHPAGAWYGLCTHIWIEFAVPSVDALRFKVKVFSCGKESSQEMFFPESSLIRKPKLRADRRDGLFWSCCSNGQWRLCGRNVASWWASNQLIHSCWHPSCPCFQIPASPFLTASTLLKMNSRSECNETFSKDCVCLSPFLHTLLPFFPDVYSQTLHMHVHIHFFLCSLYKYPKQLMEKTQPFLIPKKFLACLLAHPAHLPDQMCPSFTNHHKGHRRMAYP